MPGHGQAVFHRRGSWIARFHLTVLGDKRVQFMLLPNSHIQLFDGLSESRSERTSLPDLLDGPIYIYIYLYILYACLFVLFVLVWFGLVWFRLVWFGLVWFGLVWFGLVCWLVCLLACLLACLFVLCAFCLVVSFFVDGARFGWQ